MVIPSTCTLYFKHQAAQPCCCPALLHLCILSNKMEFSQECCAQARQYLTDLGITALFKATLAQSESHFKEESNSHFSKV